jgi:hypothetical protein
MEQALFIARADRLGYYNGDFSRIYYGTEFCERLLPSPTELRTVIDFVRDNGLAFTFVTPYVTETGLKKLRGLLDIISRELPGAEVICNEYGVLRVLHNNYPDLEPVLGRLLNRMKRGPRLMTVLDKLPATTAHYFRSNNLNVPALGDFLAGFGVRRVELDNVLQGFDFVLERFRGSLYIPYAYVSTTRLCLANGCDDPSRAEMVSISPCQRECRKYTFTMSNPIMPLKLLRKGNTIFFRNDAIPEDIVDRGIDRLVVQPELPV